MSTPLTVVTVTYSPGTHLDRFLSSLTVATERPCTVVLADNGSTDGSPEEALERYPGTRLLRTGGNLGYGTAINRAVATVGRDEEFVLVANPDVVWGPGSIDALFDAARRWPRAAALGPLVISLLTEHVFADQRLVGYSITVVVLPALLLGSGLFVLAYRAAVREVAGATAPPTLMAEIGAGRLTARE